MPHWASEFAVVWDDTPKHAQVKIPLWDANSTVTLYYDSLPPTEDTREMHMRNWWLQGAATAGRIFGHAPSKGTPTAQIVAKLG